MTISCALHANYSAAINVNDGFLIYRGVYGAFCEKHQSSSNHVDLFMNVFISVSDIGLFCCNVAGNV